jgi:hypothetical protein
MGGAYTAVGGRVDTLFYNPAGLINIPQDKGWEVNGVPLNLSAEVNKNGQSFAKDLQDALKTGDLNGDGNKNDDQLKAANDVLAKFRGDNLHVRVAASQWQRLRSRQHARFLAGYDRYHQRHWR